MVGGNYTGVLYVALIVLRNDVTSGLVFVTRVFHYNRLLGRKSNRQLSAFFELNAKGKDPVQMFAVFAATNGEG